MIPSIRSELRKLFTVRSTYIISALAILLSGIAAFYVGGFEAAGANPRWLVAVVNQTYATVGIFVAIVAILLMSHEYRHNTIAYTLAYSNSRTKVLLAKIVAVCAFALGLTIAAAALSALAYAIGVEGSSAAMLTTPEIFWSDLWRPAFYVLSYALVGLAIAALVKHVVGAIAALFVIPMVEQFLIFWLKDNIKFLPFVALEHVHSGSLLSPGHAAMLFGIYLAAVWVVAWLLFLRRDAN